MKTLKVLGGAVLTIVCIVLSFYVWMKLLDLIEFTVWPIMDKWLLRMWRFVSTGWRNWRSRKAVAELNRLHRL